MGTLINQHELAKMVGVSYWTLRYYASSRSSLRPLLGTLGKRVGIHRYYDERDVKIIQAALEESRKKRRREK